ncbi:hypothetical protein DTO012A9_10309 [Penicillium roqueforti]|nr:hypothetical protein DTO012A9_10309 [Penicillium roqueforti]
MAGWDDIISLRPSRLYGIRMHATSLGRTKGVPRVYLSPTALSRVKPYNSSGSAPGVHGEQLHYLLEIRVLRAEY